MPERHRHEEPTSGLGPRSRLPDGPAVREHGFEQGRNPVQRATVEPRSWNLPDLQREMLSSLARGDHPQGRLVEGRIVAVLATPSAGSATELAFGFSAIPAGKQTELHAHRAEEMAFILSGTGTVQIDDQSFDVGPGSVLLTPSWSHHQTTVTGTSPMLSVWVYAPAGSESRWFPAAEADAERGDE